MAKFTIYHNPRCSKSRETLALLEQNNCKPDIVLYLEQPPTEAQLTTIIKKLGIRARDLIRKKEPEYKALNLAELTLTDGDLISAMAANPRLIERPIVISDTRAVIGRPPENVLAILS